MTSYCYLLTNTSVVGGTLLCFGGDGLWRERGCIYCYSDRCLPVQVRTQKITDAVQLVTIARINLCAHMISNPFRLNGVVNYPCVHAQQGVK